MHRMPYLLASDNVIFPSIHEALNNPLGLLAVGGDLSVPRLISAYQQGIFPWYNEDEPILWWSPDPRMVLTPDQVHISRSMVKLIRQNEFSISFDRAFEDVIGHCAKRNMNTPNALPAATWISSEMQTAYINLFDSGNAHSVEVWDKQRLIGGLYGVVIGRIFFGESMFSLCANASKLAFISLAQQLKAWDFTLIDCQLPTKHLASMGAYTISRQAYQGYLNANNRLGLCSYWQAV